jgi:hypothetical protein
MTVNSDFQKKASEVISKFGLPNWAETSCPVCKKQMYKHDILSVEIHFTPMFLGDVSFSYHCKHCNCAVILHAKCDVGTLVDFVNIMNSEESELISRDELINDGFHNVRDKVWNNQKTKKTLTQDS